MTAETVELKDGRKLILDGGHYKWEEPDARRQVQYQLTGKKLLNLLRAIHIPIDALLRGAKYDVFHDVVTFLVESEEYFEVPEGAEPPVFERE